MEFLTGIAIWIAGQTGLSENVVGWLMASLLPLFSWIALKVDFAGKEKAIDDLLAGWKQSGYVAIYGWCQMANDMILRVPLLGWAWENFLEPFFLKMVSGLLRLAVRILMGLANLITEYILAISSGFNSRGENLVENRK
jgi:hypothetical protein